MITETVSTTCHEVFATINRRQISALMFHDQMADFFDFLGLMGFKRMHEYQYLVESAEHRALKRYFLNHHNSLLIEKSIEEPDVIPDSWYKYNRFEVSVQVRKQAIEKALTQYKDWEAETKRCYEKCAKDLLDESLIADYNKINKLIQDVDMELKSVDRLLLKLQAVNYNDIYVVTIQDELHEKYRELSKNIGVDIC